MLTAFQCEVVAYIGDGDIYCPDCAAESGDDSSNNAIIRYAIDEIQSERNVDYRDQGDWPEGCTDDCEPFVESCGSCGVELGEPYHYGHAEPPDGDDQSYEDELREQEQVSGFGTATR